MDYLSIDNSQVQDVLRIAEEITFSNKLLIIDDLYHRARRELNLPSNVLWDIIQYLTGHQILVEGTKFTRETVLQNEYRKKIYHLILANHGAHFCFLKKEIFNETLDKDGSSGQLIWHLGLLMKFKYVKRIKVKNNTLFLPVQMDEEEGIMHYWIKDLLIQHILAFLLEVGFISRSDLIHQIVVKREDISYRIKKLSEAQILVEDPTCLQNIGINPSKKELLKKVLNHLER